VTLQDPSINGSDLRSGHLDVSHRFALDCVVMCPRCALILRCDLYGLLVGTELDVDRRFLMSWGCGIGRPIRFRPTGNL
jgi:hypothetical protein